MEIKIIKLILILIAFLFFISSCDSDNRTITFYEENLLPLAIITYSDNSIVFHLAKELNTTCFAPTLTYRILYPNGTSNLINVYDHQIPSFNFCVGNNHFISSMNSIPNYILVLYYKFIEENNTFLAFGMMIDWSGKIISDTLLGENISRGVIYVKDIMDDQCNYFIFKQIENTYDMNIKNFASSDKGELIKIQDYLIQLPGAYIYLGMLATVDSGIFFIFVLQNDALKDSIIEPKWKIYGLMLQKESNQLDQFLIYQTSIPNLQFSTLFCSQTFDGSGFYCNVGFINSGNVSVWVKVAFLSNGKIIETKENTDVNLKNISKFYTIPLKSGGIIVLTMSDVNNGCDIAEYLLGSQNFNITIHVDFSCNAADNYIWFTNNNTALTIQEVKANNWTLLSIDIPGIFNDKGYGSPIINWIIPAINETISLEKTQLQIAYNAPIKCSSQNISIYQKIDDTKDILRETYSGESNNCQVSSDNTTLLLTVLSSTFNQPNSVYYIKIDANFVRQNNTLEPLLGISKNKWIFVTGSHHYIINNPTYAFVKLTPDGTLYFNNLSFEEKSTFSQNLLNQLAEIVPVPNKRITFSSYKVDSSTPLHQILISIKILKSNNDSVINASTIIRNLNTLINNKEFTLISQYNLTSMLDESYGLKEHKTFLELVTIPVIVIGITLFILGMIYIWAYRRCKEGKNLTIVITTLMLYDFVMDLLFIFDVKAKNLISLFWISLICTIPPILLNLFAAFYIISHENSKNQTFYKYFLKHPTIVSICSVISAADIEVLHILSSNFAGFSIFTAPFSNQAEKYIFWYSLIGFLFEDIPQFAVQPYEKTLFNICTIFVQYLYMSIQKSYNTAIFWINDKIYNVLKTYDICTI